MGRNVGYARVSTEKQRDFGVSLEAQQSKITAYCDLYNIKLDEIVVEAESGSSIKKRPLFQEIIKGVKDGAIDALIVIKLDRLGRNLKEMIEVVDLLSQKNVQLHCIQERINTDTALGKLFFHIIASLSQFEREQTAERTSFALQSKKSNGEQVSYIAPYGFQYVDGYTVPVASEQACIDYLQELRDANPNMGKKRAATLLFKAGYVNRNGSKFGVSSMKILFNLTNASGVIKEAA